MHVCKNGMLPRIWRLAAGSVPDRWTLDAAGGPGGGQAVAGALCAHGMTWPLKGFASHTFYRVSIPHLLYPTPFISHQLCQICQMIIYYLWFMKNMCKKLNTNTPKTKYHFVKNKVSLWVNRVYTGSGTGLPSACLTDTRWNPIGIRFNDCCDSIQRSIASEMIL